MVGYGLAPIRPVHSTLLNRAGGTWSASEKSKPAVTSAQYAALCLGVTFGPAANLTPLSPCAIANAVVPSTVDASAVKVHAPDERMSNASAIGRWNAVFRLMCCVPRM